MTETIAALSRNTPVQAPARIVHLGLGAFARAHLADYVRRANQLEDEPWHICGVSLRNPDVRDALSPQAALYTIIERDGPRDNPNDRYIICDAVSEVYFAGDDWNLIQARLAAPSTEIISVTVTEKGYCRRPGGALDTGNPDVTADIETLKETPNGRVTTLPGWLAQAIMARRHHNLPVTILSLDNLPDNGAALHRVVSELLLDVDEEAAAWMDSANVSFPSSVVDRIVPATTDKDRGDVAVNLELQDTSPVSTEPYTNWVLEDRFCSNCPDWAKVGVTLVNDATPFEEAKLRLVNGPHSLIAYLGQLTDRQTVDAVVADEANRIAVQQFMAEAAVTVNTPTTFDLATYQAEILTRFRNPALRHRTAQIAMDGSEKIPQRWLAAIERLRQQDRPIRFLAGALALWMRYLEGKSERGDALQITDSRAEKMMGIMADVSNPAQATVDVLTLLRSDLVDDEVLISDVAQNYERIALEGADALIRHLISRTRTRTR